MTYDVVVIGSGPGGYSAAVRAGQYGLKTAMIEKQPRLGGTCLLVGCIPTKALLHTADVWDYFKNPGAQGIQCKDPQLEFPKVMDRKNKIVTKHSKGIEFLMRKNKVDVIKGLCASAGRRKDRGSNRQRAANRRSEEHHSCNGFRSAHASRITARCESDSDEYRDPGSAGDSKEPRHHRSGRGRSGIRLHLQPFRHKSNHSRDVAAAGACGR